MTWHSVASDPPLPLAVLPVAALSAAPQILQMGGELFLNACHFIMILPVGVRMPAFFGGDVSLH